MNDRTPGLRMPFSSTFYFLAGGLTGAGVALFLAPQSGRATREVLRRKLGDTAGSAGDLKDQVIRSGQKIRDQARLRVADAVSALTGDEATKVPA